MDDITVLVERGTERPLVQGRCVEGSIRDLERRAIVSPEAREAILDTLNDYASRFRGTHPARAAKMAAKRISAVVMLECLGEPRVKSV